MILVRAVLIRPKRQPHERMRTPEPPKFILGSMSEIDIFPDSNGSSNA